MKLILLMMTHYRAWKSDHKKKKKELTETEPLFGRYIHVEPKMGILKWMRYNNELTSTNFYRKNKELGWIYVSLSLNINNLKNKAGK